MFNEWNAKERKNVLIKTHTKKETGHQTERDHNMVKKEQCSIKIYRHYVGCCKDNVL